MVLDLLIFGGLAFLIRYKVVGRRIHWGWALLSAILVWIASVAGMWWSAFESGTVSTGILGRSIWYALFTALAVYFILRKKSSQEESSSSAKDG